MSKIGKSPPTSEITPELLYMRRREFMRNAVLFTATTAGVGGSLLWLMRGIRAERNPPRGTDAAEASQRDLVIARHSNYSVDEALAPYRDVTSYNNFYEFGTDKGDPAENARTLRPRPWTVAIEGEVSKPQVIDVEQLLA